LQNWLPKKYDMSSGPWGTINKFLCNGEQT
jgi:hypothetical protein